MGNFVGSIMSSSSTPEVFIDFEKAQPTAQERKIHGVMTEVLSRGQELIKEIHDYKGCQQLQRAAMMNRTPDAESVCFTALLDSVSRINDFFTFSQRLEREFPILLTNVCQFSGDSSDILADKQALAKQVAEVLDFTLRFDAQRMLTSALSNDFSYYRRLLSKFSSHPDIIVTDDDAATMAMFTAQYQPMMETITKAGVSAFNQNPHIKPGLAVLANSCRMMIEAKKFQSPATTLFCARAMTGAIVLYDRIDADSQGMGVFHKKSPIKVKACIQLLKRQFPDEGGLLNAIHYSTSTFNNASSSIQALFE